MPGLWDPTESKASENKFPRGMCLPNRVTENKQDKQITPQILMGRKRRRKRMCAGGLEGFVCLLRRWGVVRSFQAGERDLMEQCLADTRLLQSPEKQPPSPSSLSISG